MGPDPVDPSTMTRGKTTRMDDLLRDFERWGFDQRGYAHRTRVHYRQRARAADTWLRANRQTALARATVRDVQIYHQATPATSKNRNTVRQALVAWFDYLISIGRRDDNPGLALPRLPEPRPIPKALTGEQARAVLSAAATHGAAWHALIALMLYAGLRRDEARTLEWSQIEGPWLRLTGKGGQVRVMPLHDEAVAALTRWRAECPCPRWIAPSPDPHTDGPIGTNAVNSHVRHIGETAGVDGLHPHVLRHTYATGLLEAGADIATVQQAMGHAALSSTQVYLRVRDGRVREAVASLDW